MSRIIDERVTQMRFDNKDFEANVKTSMGTLDKLKKSLNFSGSTDSLANLGIAVKNVGLEHLGMAVENVKMKFSAMQIMGITALANITNSAVNAGKRIVSALTIDPIKTGFQEYETQMNAVQTILANTQSKGKTLADVNSALNELNKYADQTIYNFTEMTRNIGTFTAAGVDLETSVSSIKGIANLAAVSGSTSQQASTAMYQLSQALATGKVALQDWNSVVNAGMGGELFQNALKRTATQMGVDVEGMIATYGSFRESLTQGGWLTGEVLTETLTQLSGAYTEADLIAKGYTESQAKEIAELAKTAVSAATEVKTFTQLWDTLKEAAQSGWTQSWQIIVGDFEEAKVLLTGISDAVGEVINSWSDSRNTMLQDWKDLGGRTLMIEGLKNAIQGLITIIKPIGQAFREIFPAMTGKDLFGFTEAFKNFADRIKIADSTADKIKRTFKGLFAILDIGKEAFFSFTAAIEPVTSLLWSALDAFLSFTASVGDYVVGISEIVGKSNLFKVVMEDLVNFVQPLADKIKTIFDGVRYFFNSLSGLKTDEIDAIAEKIDSSFRPFTKLGEIISTLYGWLKTGFTKLTRGVSKALELAGTSLGEGLDSPTFTRLFSLINGGLMGGIVYGLKKLVDGFHEIADVGGDLLSGITGILDGVKDCLAAYQQELKSKTLINIAKAIAILAGSLFVLSLIDPSRLAASLTAMTVLIAELYGSMMIYEKLSSDKGLSKVAKSIGFMIGIATAVGILSIALVNIGRLNWDEVGKGLVGVAGMAGILVASVKMMGDAGNGLKTSAVGLVILASALKILSDVVITLGQINFNNLMEGLLGVGVLCVELALFLKLANFDGFGVLKGVGLITLAASLNILATAVDKFGQMDPNKLMQGLLAVTTILAELVLFVRLTNQSEGVVSAAFGMLVLSGAMIVFTKAIESMGAIPLNNLIKGLVSMAAGLTVMVLALNLLNEKDIISKGASLVILAAALYVLGGALKSMGSMKWEEIGKGLLVMAASLTMMVVALNLLKGSLGAAAAIFIVAGAIGVLTPALKALGKMSWGEILKSLLALAGAFLVIGVAGLLLTPIIPSIIGLGVAVALLGAGCLAAGVGLLAFSAGLGVLAAVGAAGITALIQLIKAVFDLLPYMVKAIGQAIIGIFEELIAGIPVIAKAIGTLIVEVVKLLVEYIPVIVDAVVKLITYLIEKIVEFTPELIKMGADFIVNFLDGIADNMGRVAEAGVNVILTFLQGIADSYVALVDGAFEVMITFINGLAEAIETNAPLLADAIERLITAMLTAGKDIILSWVQPFLDSGKELMETGFMQGIKDKVAGAVECVSGLISDCLDAIGGFVGDFVEAGGNLIGGLVEGILGMAGSAVSAVGDAAGWVIDKAKSVFGIHSPSRVFAEMGMYLNEGLAVGLRKYSNLAENASEEVGDSAIFAMKNALSNVVLDEIDAQPTIRPVIDMTDIQNGADEMNKLFSDTPSMNLAYAGSLSAANIGSISTNMANKTGGDANIVSALKDLKNTITKSTGTSYNINGITYDDGSNVAMAVKDLVRAAKIGRRI